MIYLELNQGEQINEISFPIFKDLTGIVIEDFLDGNTDIDNEIVDGNTTSKTIIDGMHAELPKSTSKLKLYIQNKTTKQRYEYEIQPTAENIRYVDFILVSDMNLKGNYIATLYLDNELIGVSELRIINNRQNQLIINNFNKIIYEFKF
jgi:hypothetical protein